MIKKKNHSLDEEQGVFMSEGDMCMDGGGCSTLSAIESQEYLMSSTSIFAPIVGKWQFTNNESNHSIGNIEIKAFPVMGWTFLHVIRRLALGLSSSYSVSGFRFSVNNYGKESVPCHQYESLPGVVEDVTYIHYNVKGIILKVTVLGEGADDYFILKINSNTAGPLYAGSIDAGSFNKTNEKIQVEIVNKDHLICHLDLNTSINGEILFRYGFGYASEEDQEKYFESYFTKSSREGWFYLSAQFSNNVLSVTGDVTEVTSGSVPYDLLRLQVVTNGSTSPEDVVKGVFDVLRKQMLYASQDVNKAPVNPVENRSSYDRKKLLRDLGFLDAVVNLLERQGIFTLGELLGYSEKSLRAIKGFGSTKLQHIKDILGALNLSLPLQDSEKREKLLYPNR